MIQVFSYENGLKKINITEAPFPSKNLIWIDITDITKEESNYIREIFNLHHLTTEDFFNQNSRIKVEEFPHYLFCVFYGIKRDNELCLVEFDTVISKNLIITNHKQSLDSIEQLKRDGKKLENLFKKGSEYLFHKILDMEIEAYFPLLEKIEEQTESIEEKAISNSSTILMAKILEHKRLIVKLKRQMIAQRDKVSFLAKNDYKHISKKALPYFRDVYDNTIRIVDTIDNQREAIGNCFDVYMSTISNNMNQVMKVLSIIATISLPLGVISGIYGTNFSELPGSEVVSGFWIMIFFMALIIITMLYIFKRLKWF